MSIMFDTFEFVRRAKEVGFTEDQAYFCAVELSNLIKDEVATKRDLKVVESSLKRDMKDIELRLTIKLGSIMVIGMGILVFILKN